jgi:hypothetical protein
MFKWIRGQGPAHAPVGPIDLPAGQAHRLRLCAGDVLLVRRGRVWMTREGDPLDHLLTPAQGHVASHPQDVVLESCAREGSVYERLALPGRVNVALLPFRPLLSRLITACR